MTEARGTMMQGTLDLLVLKIVSLEPMHGWGITLRIEQMSQQVLQVNQGSLYPALERLTRRGWLRSEWRTTESNRRARFYELTALGRRRLETELVGWARSSAAINAILGWRGALP